MTRATRFVTYAAIFATVYALVWLDVLAIPFVDASLQAQLLPVLPWWSLVAFGAYSLWSLGYGLYTFKDTPEAYEELMQEISQAKDELRTKGVTVD